MEKKLVVHPTSTADWQALVQEAGANCQAKLGEELESYLVFLLMRFTECPDIARQVMALEFLQGQNQSAAVRSHTLQGVGDKCLLFSGLFPGRAEKLRVRISYFVGLGRSAYASVSEHQSAGMASLFAELSEHFVPLMDVLQATRAVSGDVALDLMQATELWQDTQSQAAKRRLERETESMPIIEVDSPAWLKH